MTTLRSIVRKQLEVAATDEKASVEVAKASTEKMAKKIAAIIDSMGLKEDAWDKLSARVKKLAFESASVETAGFLDSLADERIQPLVKEDPLYQEKYKEIEANARKFEELGFKFYWLGGANFKTLEHLTFHILNKEAQLYISWMVHAKKVRFISQVLEKTYGKIDTVSDVLKALAAFKKATAIAEQAFADKTLKAMKASVLSIEVVMLRTTGRPSFKRKRYFKAPDTAYGKDWATISDYVRRRDNYKCQAHKIGLPVCPNRFPPPFTSLLHAHHIVPLPRGSNHPTNLVTLCRSCHGLHHKKNLGYITDKQKKAGKRISGLRCK